MLVHLCSSIAHRRGATRRLDHAVELDQHQFTGAFKDIASEFGDQRLYDLSQERGQTGEAVGFVAGEQPAVASDQNRR